MEDSINECAGGLAPTHARPELGYWTGDSTNNNP